MSPHQQEAPVIQLLIARYRANTRNVKLVKPLTCQLALTLTILSLGIGLVLGSDSQIYSPGGIVREVYADSALSELESLNVPMPGMGIRSTEGSSRGQIYGASGQAQPTDLVRINPGLVVVNIPPQESPPVVPPRIRFEDVTSASGLGSLLSDSYIHTSSWGDVDGDGWLDLFVGTFVGSSFPDSGDSSAKPDPARLVLNQNGFFQDSGQSDLAIYGRGAGSVLADLNNDGELDLFISNNRKNAGDQPSHILRNDIGVFVDVTLGSGIDAQSLDGRQVGVLDYDNDGLLDLFVLGGFHVPGPTVLLKNLGGLRFQNVTGDAGLPTEIHGLGLAIGDVTGNGWPDIFVGGGPTRTNQHNYMLIANGDGTYHSLGGNVFDWNPFAQQSEDWVGGAAFADLNRDGRLDLLVGQHFESAETTGESLRVYLNQGLQGLPGIDPVFSDITAVAGLPKIFTKAPHVEIQDFDNDGWPDLYASVRIDSAEGVEPLIFTHNGNSGNPTFSAPEMVNPYYYPGGPVADFNKDGKMDVLLPRVDTRLLQNTGAPGNWLKVNVDLGAGLNRFGIGAKVKIYRTGTNEILGFREISASTGFSSSQGSTAHFGLGSEALIDIVVEMPFGGPVYSRFSVPANQEVNIPDGVVDTTPETNITGNPPSLSAVTTASFSFISSETGSSFECQIDNGGFSGCNSPHSYTDLADGAHTFQARATGVNGNLDPTPASYTWTVDNSTPTGDLITNIVVSNGKTYQRDALGVGQLTYADRSYTFTTVPNLLDGQEFIRTANNDKNAANPDFLAFDLTTDATVFVLFDDRATSLPAWLDDGSWSQIPDPVGTTDVTRRVYQKPFGAGTVRLEGNAMAPVRGAGSMYNVVAAVATGTNDLETSITGNPPGLSPLATASFSFASSEAGSSFECQLDDDGFSGCSSPHSYTSLADGAHTFQVRAIDGAGNVDPTPANYSWTVDTSTSTGDLITNIVVSNGKTYQKDTLRTGQLTFTDRSYTFTTVPNLLDGQDFIRTANNDKKAADPNFLTFILTGDATVFVLFDDRATSLPAWLDDGSWSQSPDTVGTTDVNRQVYQKPFDKGTVRLEGNAMAPMAGARSMYNVVAAIRNN